MKDLNHTVFEANETASSALGGLLCQIRINVKQSVIYDLLPDCSSTYLSEAFVMQSFFASISKAAANSIAQSCSSGLRSLCSSTTPKTHLRAMQTTHLTSCLQSLGSSNKASGWFGAAAGNLAPGSPRFHIKVPLLKVQVPQGST